MRVPTHPRQSLDWAVTAPCGAPQALGAPRRRDSLAWALALSGLAASGAWAAPVDAGEPLHLVYPSMPERPPEAYGYQLLRLALEKAGMPYTLRIADEPISGLRARNELLEKKMSLVDAGTAPDAEKMFDLVPFPLDLGLSGVRLLVVRHDTLPALRTVETLADLRRFRFGQGNGWIDTLILRDAGLDVETGQVPSLFRMLQARRFDLLPLGAEEAHALLARYQGDAPAAVVANDLALHYHFARVFMLARGQPRLFEALQRGLQLSHADGSLQRVLASQSGLGPLMQDKGRLPGRLIHLPNHRLPPVYDRIPSQYLHPRLRTLPRP